MPHMKSASSQMSGLRLPAKGEQSCCKNTESHACQAASYAECVDSLSQVLTRTFPEDPQ
jgi:hypothetical protein